MDEQNALSGFHCPRYEELPTIDLYMDQVIQILSLTVNALYGPEDAVTSAMINNYVKHKVIPAPVKKKYRRDHICRLLFICVLKRVFSISEISALLTWQENTCDITSAYNAFCLELERALEAVFSHTSVAVIDVAPDHQRGADVMHSMVLAIAHKVYVQRALRDVCRATPSD